MIRDKTPAQLAFYKRQSERLSRMWQKKEYRERIVKKQKELGYRTYV